MVMIWYDTVYFKIEKSFQESIMYSSEMEQSYYEPLSLHRPISYHSRLPITLTFKGNRKKIRVIESSKKITESKVKNSFYYTVNIFITFNCRNVKWKLKILLDYKSERNVTKHSPDRAYVLLFSEEKPLHISLWQSTSASTSKLYSYNTSIGNPKFNVSDASRRLFSRLLILRAQNMVRVIEGKII